MVSTEVEAVTALPKVPETLAEKQQRLAILAEDTRRRLKRSALDIYYIGLNLLEAQNITAHGEFLPWLRREFGMGKTSAYEFIHVASAFSAKLPIIGNLLDAIAPTALYKLAAPSTPEAARSEAIERVLAGEVVGPDIASEIIKKHKLPKTPKTQQPSVGMTTQEGITNQVEPYRNAAICPTTQIQATTASLARMKAPRVTVSPSQPTSADAPGVWWRLSGQHLLYCGNPNSAEFLTQIPERIQLLLAFPPAKIWRSRIKIEAQITVTDYFPVFYNLSLLNEVIGEFVLSNSCIDDLIVSCFVPSPDIFLMLNRLKRRGVFAEPNLSRCNAVIDVCQRAGLLVDQLT